MKKNVLKLIGIVIVFTVIAYNVQVNTKSADISSLTLANIRAMTVSAGEIGRVCFYMCVTTGNPSDFCTQCGSICTDSFFKVSSGQSGNCPL